MSQKKIGTKNPVAVYLFVYRRDPDTGVVHVLTPNENYMRGLKFMIMQDKMDNHQAQKIASSLTKQPILKPFGSMLAAGLDRGLNGIILSGRQGLPGGLIAKGETPRQAAMRFMTWDLRIDKDAAMFLNYLCTSEMTASADPTHKAVYFSIDVSLGEFAEHGSTTLEEYTEYYNSGNGSGPRSDAYRTMAISPMETLGASFGEHSYEDIRSNMNSMDKICKLFCDRVSKKAKCDVATADRERLKSELVAFQLSMAQPHKEAIKMFKKMMRTSEIE